MGDFIRYDVREVDLNKPLLRTNTGVLLAAGDKSANRFGAILHRDGEPVNMAGQAVTVMGYFVRPDGNTVVCKGAQNGNMVYVDLPAACYAQSGAFSLAIKVNSPDTTQTVRVIDGVIRLTSTDAIADPDEKVINISELMKMIEDAEAAADRAEAAADRAEAAGGNSGTGSGGDGYSPVANVQQTADGAVITITDASGTTTATVYHGEDGAKGDTGSDGVGIASIKQTTTSSADAGSNVFTVTLTNGTSATFTVKNGSKGSKGATGETGAAGADGKTPVKGTDYYTTADKTEMAGLVKAALPTLTLTGVDADGVTHTYTIYGS